ncbi:response regulator [Oceanobacillus sp. 143]|uniref:DNA-binding response regulator n=1 Tax=Oceanobacillus zhaokaii TaxID=2052660 RepID=A0A345PKE2_9BACI|nr:response regulator transcription factor [Oceanobacillus zhaokaii]AXI10472.1 DNA-binding response regulator [Oceanobacillus zhaokaii]QGS69484.1 response regulator [Oceanobacillus sp. 143]
MIKVLLVDDQRLFREGVKSILERAEDIHVTGTADNGKEAIQEIEQAQPDVVVMDIHMPEMDGVETTSYVKRNYPGIKVVLLTTRADDDFIISGINTGADGLLLKNLYADKLIDCIRDASCGVMVLSGEVSRILANRIRELTLNKKQILALRLERSGYQYTNRELDVFYLLMEGNTNNQIAHQLFLSLGTVKNYISDIYNKLNIRNRENTIMYFQELITAKDNI